MSLVRRLARPLLAATFIQTGVSTLRNPGPQVDRVRPLVDQMSGPLHLPADPELLLRVDGALLAGAGGLLALGRMPRLAALALVVGAAPTTYPEVAFWQEKDPELRRARRTELLTRLGLIGGALLATVDTAGRPGLVWRGRHAVGHVQHSAADARDDARHAAELAAGLVGHAAHRRARQTRKQAKLAAVTARQSRKLARQAAAQTRQRAETARKEAQRAVERTRRQAAGAARDARRALPV